MVCKAGNIRTMDRLAAEILDEIFQYVPIHDLEKLEEAMTVQGWSWVFDRALSRRFNPCTYLSGTFVNPEALLDCMTTSSAAILGARALEYFIPGTVDPNSSWDFIVSNEGSAIGGMISTLQACGVQWESPVQRMVRLLRISTVPIAEFNGLVSGIMQPDDEGYNNLEERIQALPEQLKLGILRLIAIELEHRPSKPESSGIKTSSIEGNIPRKNRQGFKVRLKWEAPIQPYGERRASVLDHVKRLPLSHLQCFLTGFAAGHMYYEALKRRVSYIWSPLPLEVSEEITRDELTLCRAAKTESVWRGRHRHLGDDQSKIISFERFGFVKSRLVGDFVELLKCASWYEFEHEIVGVDGPFEAIIWHESRTALDPVMSQFVLSLDPLTMWEYSQAVAEHNLAHVLAACKYGLLELD